MFRYVAVVLLLAGCSESSAPPPPPPPSAPAAGEHHRHLRGPAGGFGVSESGWPMTTGRCPVPTPSARVPPESSTTPGRSRGSAAQRPTQSPDTGCLDHVGGDPRRNLHGHRNRTVETGRNDRVPTGGWERRPADPSDHAKPFRLLDVGGIHDRTFEAHPVSGPAGCRPRAYHILHNGHGDRRSCGALDHSLRPPDGPPSPARSPAGSEELPGRSKRGVGTDSGAFPTRVS